ncbi:MAG: hypothetical protein KJ674_03020 [Nanoarchaeota archaeon]|nr:hypothetical protein [Nanoarchaeota archaeon]
MAVDISTLFYDLQGSGVYEFVLPFLLVFAIVFAVLEKTKIFGSDKRNVNAIIAVLFGLLFVSQVEIIEKLNLFLPKISFFMIIVLMVLILIGMMGVKVSEGVGPLLMIAGAIISIIAVYWALGPSLGFEVPYWVQDNWTAVIGVVILLVVIYMVVSPGGTGQKGKDLAEGFHDLLFKHRP